MSEGEKTMTKATKTAVLGEDLVVRIGDREIGRVFRTKGRYTGAIRSGGGYEPVGIVGLRNPASAASFVARKVGARLEGRI